MQSSIELRNRSVYNTDEPIATANVINVNTADTNDESIQIADIATSEDINNYSLEILDTEQDTNTTIISDNIDYIILRIIYNKPLRINLYSIEPIYTFLKMRSQVLEYYIFLFIINLIYNVFNIFNIVIFIPLLYYLFVISYPNQKHLDFIPYFIIMSIIINICINIGITLNIYIFGVHYIQYITPTIHSGLIFYISTLYLLSLTNTFIQCMFLKDIVYLKRYYIKLKIYLLQNQSIHDIIIQNLIALNPIQQT
jgi:hypothetical protein